MKGIVYIAYCTLTWKENENYGEKSGKTKLLGLFIGPVSDFR